MLQGDPLLIEPRAGGTQRRSPAFGQLGDLHLGIGCDPVALLANHRKLLLQRRTFLVQSRLGGPQCRRAFPGGLFQQPRDLHLGVGRGGVTLITNHRELLLQCRSLLLQPGTRGRETPLDLAQLGSMQTLELGGIGHGLGRDLLENRQRR